MKRIQVCLNKGLHSFPREDYKEIVKIHYELLKTSSRNNGQISTKSLDDIDNFFLRIRTIQFSKRI